MKSQKICVFNDAMILHIYIYTSHHFLLPVITLYIIFNLFISENLKTAQGQYTDQHVERISKLYGVIWKDIEKVVSKKLTKTLWLNQKQLK